VGKALYAIDAFPDDDQLWRIEWMGGVRYNASVPSEPLLDICLAQLPSGEANPLSAKSRSSETKTVVKIGVGLLPYLSIASVWQKRRPVAADFAVYRRQLRIDTKSCRTEMLGDLPANYNGIPRSCYLFGASWPHVRETLLLALEQDGDPFGVLVPTAEIVRFYYAPSTRLAQALFWGEYGETFNAERSGVLEKGVVRVHLRRWLEDQDAWTLARYMCSPAMQHETSRLSNGLQLYQLNSPSAISAPNQNLPCGFPFEGSTIVQAICLPLPRSTSNTPPRWLILRLERCSAPFPFDRVIVDRDNNSIPGENAEDENLAPAWAKAENNAQEVEKQAPDTFRANEEPRRGLDPLRIDLVEDRFEGLKGKKLVKEEKTVQRFRHSLLKVAAIQMLTGLGTGQGTWGSRSLQLTKLTTVQSREPQRRDVPVLPASMETFVQAIDLLAEKHRQCEVAFIGTGERDTSLGAHTLASFPTHELHKRKRIAWAWIKAENRPRRVAIAEIRSENKIAYALEIERIPREHAILVLARSDFQRIGAHALQSFLLECALRRGWVPEDQMPGYRRKTTTHRELVAISVLESRIWRKTEELLGSAPRPESV
jgi:hypothetical protein